MIDWTKIVLNFIDNLPATLLAIGTLFVSIYNAVKIHHVEKATNGMKDKLMEISRADGKKEGIMQEQTKAYKRTDNGPSKFVAHKDDSL